jgi:hypothetical protein
MAYISEYYQISPDTLISEEEIKSLYYRVFGKQINP